MKTTFWIKYFIIKPRIEAINAYIFKGNTQQKVEGFCYWKQFVALVVWDDDQLDNVQVI